MMLRIYCVKDSATQMFGNPMFMLATGQAIRSFSDEVNRSGGDNQLYQHPDDFELYELGVYDGNRGCFETHDPILVVRGKDLKNASQS